jgi:hypothetical protein
MQILHFNKKPIYIVPAEVYKDTMTDNQLNYKFTVQPNNIFETILQGEGHMT